MVDFLIGFLFWLTYEILSWPLRLALTPIPMSGDVRRMISRVAGPAMIAFAAWLLAHIGVPLGFFTAWTLFAVFAVAGYYICRLQGHTPNLLKVISPITDLHRKRREIFVEVFSILIFFSFLAFRRWVPEMTVTTLNGSGSEKFDNAMFFWSSWHAVTLPPDDYWLSGNRLAYYYYGHYFWAWIGRVGLFPGEFVITLGMSRLVELIWDSSYLLIRAFGARAVSAALGAFFVTWGGNPAAIKTFFNQYDNFVGRTAEQKDKRDFRFAARYLDKFETDPKNKFQRKWDWGSYMYWDPAHNVIPKNIVEYPAWTAILGDFHAHHHSVAWTLGFAALVVGGHRWFKLRRKQTRNNTEAGDTEADDEADAQDEATDKYLFVRYALWMSAFLVVGISAVISNLWAGPLTGALALGILVWRRIGNMRVVSDYAIRMSIIILLAVGMLVCTKITMGTLANPVTAGDKSQDKNVSLFQKMSERPPVRRLPENLKSTLPQIFLHWGFHLAILIVAIPVLLVSRARSLRRTNRWPVVCGLLVAAAVTILLELLVLKKETGLMWIALAFALASLRLGRPAFRPMGIYLTIGICLLLALLEYYFVDDPMSGDFERYNSYFKHAVPAWGLLLAGTWMCVQRMWHARIWSVNGWFPVRYALRLALLLLLPLTMGMVAFGMPARVKMARYGENPKNPRVGTLNAFAWLAKVPEYEAEAQMLEWIRRNVPPGERVAEAVHFDSFDRYNYVGRVASLAGHPVPLGWEGHEFTWRGDGAMAPVTKNKNGLRALYLAPSAAAMKKAAKDLGVRYVVFGKSEMDILKGKTNNIQAANAVYVKLLQAGTVVAMYPRVNPKVFVFEIKQ